MEIGLFVNLTFNSLFNLLVYDSSFSIVASEKPFSAVNIVNNIVTYMTKGKFLVDLFIVIIMV